MSDETISPLRRRMIEDMTVRNFSADTQRNYIRGVKNLAVFLGRSPNTATPEAHLRQFGPVRRPESRRFPGLGGGWSSRCSATFRIDCA
jgi:integrase/recombinase XerD